MAMMGLGIVALATLANAEPLPARMPVLLEGDTDLSRVVPGGRVTVRIRTRKLPDGSGDEERYSLLGAGRRNRVQRLEVVLGGTRLFVPGSALCDLTDLKEAALGTGKKGPILSIFGGDAAESYIVKIEFDQRMAIRRIVESALIPGSVTQDARYYLRTLKDE